MKAIRRATAIVKKWFEFKDAKKSLDFLLSAAPVTLALEDRLAWLVELARWVRTQKTIKLEGPAPEVPPQVVRVRFLLNVLDRNPEWKLRVARSLRSIVRDTNALDLFCDTGMPRQLGFLSEAGDRLLRKLLPQAPSGSDLGAIMDQLFPSEADATWLAQLDAETIGRFQSLFLHEVGEEEAGWNSLLRDAEDALFFLSSQIRSAGLSAPVRARIAAPSFRELPFFSLGRSVDRFTQARAGGNFQETILGARTLVTQLDECRAATRAAYSHLGEFGVSVAIVYQLERIRAQLERSKTLVDVLAGDVEDRVWIAKFISRLVADNLAQDSVLALLRQNFSLLSQKVVERSAEIGEHYIARNPEEYRHMLKSAAGGGALTGVTTTIKFGITGLHLSAFFEGILASLNYSASFILIQLLGFSLATKQPATTAPAIAAHMENLSAPGQVERVVDEVVYLIRSQIAGIIGNVSFVIPATLFFELLARLLAGRALISVEKAEHTLASLSVLGPSWPYAAFTGLLLWLASYVSGSVDNFYAYRGLGKALEKNPRLVFVFGASGAEKISRFFTRNIAGFAANVSLGLFLGLLPSLLQFVGLPIEVRHVTLSTGAVAASVSALGPESLLTAPFWLAVLGVIGIGTLNVAVSFSVALFLAIRGRGIAAPERRAVYRGIRRRFRRAPLSLFFPPKAKRLVN